MSMRIALSFYLFSLSVFAMQQQFVPDTHAVSEEIVGIKNVKLTVFSSHSLTTHNSEVDRIIVTLQGNKRDARARVRAVLASLPSAQALRTTLVISPNFKIETDEPGNQEPFWSNSGWKQGDKSKDASRIGSFTALDLVLKHLIVSKNFPGLKKVFISGHSAGGQLTQRYALTSQIPELFPQVEFKFLVMNPSSYAYLDGRRPFTLGQFPPRTYNHYKYGLEKLNSYAKHLTASQIRAQYLKRCVFYIVGHNDNDPNHDELDKSEAAMLQGADRLSRGRLFHSYIKTYYPENRHHLVEIPGVGHEAEKIYDALDVKSILFSL